jgi:hypothetical protein
VKAAAALACSLGADVVIDYKTAAVEGGHAVGKVVLTVG